MGAARQLGHRPDLEQEKLLLIIHAELNIHWATDHIFQLFCIALQFLQCLVGKHEPFCARHDALFDIALTTGGFFQNKLLGNVSRCKTVKWLTGFAIVAPDCTAMGPDT